MIVERKADGMVEVRFIKVAKPDYKKRMIYHLDGNQVLSLSFDEVPYMVCDHFKGQETVAIIQLPAAIAQMYGIA